MIKKIKIYKTLYGFHAVTILKKHSRFGFSRVRLHQKMMKPYTREGETLKFFLNFNRVKTVKRFINFYLFLSGPGCSKAD